MANMTTAIIDRVPKLRLPPKLIMEISNAGIP
jgi:hypothetical protein